MTKNKLVICFIFTLSLVFFSSNSVFAHPGRTASDGCHYCKTNCASWGEVSGARHCHGGYSAPAPVYTAPTIKPTVKPTVVSTIKPTSKPPSPSPKVKGESDEQQTLKPSPANKETEEDGGGGIIPLLGASGLGYLWYKNKKKNE